MKLSFKSRLLLLVVTSVGVLMVMMVLSINSLMRLDTDFQTMKDTQINGNVAVLKITANMNYISRLSRNMMLGSDYDSDYQKLEDRIKQIEEGFMTLEASLSGKEETALFDDAKTAALAFVYGARDIADQLKALPPADRYSFYTQYTEQTTDLANASRQHFNALSRLIEESFKTGMAAYAHRITLMKRVLFIVSLVAAAFLIVFGIFFSRSMLRLLGIDPYELSAIAGSISQGDLRRQKQDKIVSNSVQDFIITMQDRLNKVIQKIVDSANNVHQGSQNVNGSSQDLNEGANEQAAAAEEISSSIEEMLANIEQNTANAKLVEAATKEVEQGIIAVKEKTVKTTEANRLIVDKIAIINDIAMQTNILALNASVEAARAGEHGKGFAVVAGEVRKLAEVSKESADEITQLSNDSLEQAEEAVSQIEMILPGVNETTNMAMEIAAASSEQMHEANQVSTAITQMNAVAQQNAAASEELASHADDLAGQADELNQVVAQFILD
ncbi:MULTISPECIES: methyl-accepting chemotaxis protein [unclassified Carboxylicivirga]|uniref:methyl-accepting chemotaxis protein n=1 Tax=Carboxylicivirga TaxID=1628153 RepID=UPI003D352A6A